MDDYLHSLLMEYGATQSPSEIYTFRCPLPDHLDNNPSSNYMPDNEWWKCHSCDRNGPKKELIAMLEKILNKTGDRSERYIPAMTPEYYRACTTTLLEKPSGRAASEYLIGKRKLPIDLIKRHSLGWDPAISRLIIPVYRNETAQVIKTRNLKSKEECGPREPRYLTEHRGCTKDKSFEWRDTASDECFIMEGEINAMVGNHLYPSNYIGLAGATKPYDFSVCNKYRKIYFISDGDSAAKGLEDRIKAAVDNTKLYKLEFDVKDLNDLLVKYGKKTKDEYLAAIHAAEPYEHKIRFISAAELLTMDIPPMKWVVDKMLAKSNASIFAAVSGAGKSTCARQLGLAIARGEDFLGRKTTKGSVWYCAMEEDIDYAHAQLLLQGVRSEDDFHLWCERKITPANALEQVSILIKEHRPSILFVDTLANLIPIENINHYTHVKEIMDNVISIARRYGTHLCFLHHENKSSDAQGMHKILGTSALVGCVDQVIQLTQEGTVRYFSCSKRGVLPIEKKRLEFDSATQSFSWAKERELDPNNWSV